MLHENIRQRRLQLGYSQAALAELADCGVEAIGRIERKERTPNSDTLARIASALECTMDSLVGCLAPPRRVAVEPPPAYRRLIHRIRKSSPMEVAALDATLSAICSAKDEGQSDT